MQRIADFAATLLAGGTMEIVLLIVLVIVGIILLVIALWLAWKLLGVIGSGLKWAFQRGGEAAQARSIARREAELARPPLVATGWGGTGRFGLRTALAQALRQTSRDALRIVVVAGESGFADLCRGLDLSPPGASRIGIAAGTDIILIDASRASPRELARLGRALPWRRPLDGVAMLATAEGLPEDGIARATSLARTTGTKAALHLVLPSANDTSVWRVIDAANHSGDDLCSQLAADSVRTWLTGGDRSGLEELAVAQSRRLPQAIDRALGVAPAGWLDVASLAFGGAGLRGAAAQAASRTRPSTAPGLVTNLAIAGFALGVLLTALAAFWVSERTDQLRGALSTAAREAATPWSAEGVDAIPNGARVQRIAGLGARLAEHSHFSLMTPLAPALPNWSAPGRLGGALLNGYVLRPLGASLERRAEVMLAAHDAPGRWLDDARRVAEWLAAWEGLADDPREVDVRALLAAGLGGTRAAWPEDVDIALIETGGGPPTAEEGGLDVPRLTDLARANFGLTMQHWAVENYVNGPVPSAARRAIAGGATWREQHAALVDLREALQSPGQQWLTAAEDRSDHAVELRILGRALALGLIGQTATVEAKAEVARIRIDARELVTHFVLPELGVLLERSGTGSGPSLRMTAPASAWLMFLDKVANAGFAEPLGRVRPLLQGLVTVDRTSVAQARERLRVFDRFAANLAADVPAGPAQRLLLELSAELTVGVVADVENALRRETEAGIASERAERRAVAAVALEDMSEIKSWLRARQAHAEAGRVARVAARVADGIVRAASDMLDEEDPLATYLDPTADGNAVVRRFERGLEHTRRIHEQFVAPYLDDVTAEVGGWAALHWREMSRDLEEFARGDTNSTLTQLEGSIRAWAEDPRSACDAPRIMIGRGDYLARASSRFRNELGAVCEGERQKGLATRFGVVESYFDDYVRDWWPYAPDTVAPEASVATMDEFVRKLHEHAEVFTEFADPLAELFAQSADFWTRDQNGAALRFEADWRWRPGEEHLAEHVADARFEGIEQDDAGLYTWSYGRPFALRLRLARNSPYSFVTADGRRTREWSLAPSGFGAFLRAFDGLSGGSAVIRADVAADDSDAASAEIDELRISLRLTLADGRGMTMPNFRAPAGASR